MHSDDNTRRDALRALGAFAATAGAVTLSGCAQPQARASAMAQPVRWSAGLERPRTRVPADAIDRHHHIYDARYPVAPEASHVLWGSDWPHPTEQPQKIPKDAILVDNPARLYQFSTS